MSDNNMFDVDLYDTNKDVFTDNVEIIDSYNVDEYTVVDIIKNTKTNDIYYRVDEPELYHEFEDKVDWRNEVKDEKNTRDYSILLNILKKKVEKELKTDNLLEDDIDTRREKIKSKTEELLDNINTGYDFTDYPLNIVDKLYYRFDNEKFRESKIMRYMMNKSLDYSSRREKIPEDIRNKLLYYVIRDLAGYYKLQPLFNDDKIEDLSVNKPNSPTMVYHEDYDKHIMTNIAFDSDELSTFTKKLAQQAGRNLSRANPTSNGSLLDGSRIRINFEDEVSPEGSSFTIRFLNDEPLSPIHLIDFETYNYEQMAYLWLLIENKKSIIIAGGTASGKTTTLNALTMFIDRNNKIISIEDTQEISTIQINESKRLTRESFMDQKSDGIDEFDLTKGALRERPDFILVGEVRGEEAQSMFQAMNTGHTTLSTLHAESPRSVINRLESEKMGVQKELMEAIDVIMIQNRLRRSGDVRAEHIEEIQDMNSQKKLDASKMYDYDKKNDDYNKLYTNEGSSVLREIMKSQRLSEEELNNELEDREKVLREMKEEEIFNYEDCYTIFQQYMSDKEYVMNIIQDENKQLIDIIEDNALKNKGD